MKAPNLFIASIILFTALESCHQFGRHVTTIATSNNSNYQKVEYSGTVVFSVDKTAIERMSPGSYLKFTTNNDKLIAESDSKGIITYEFLDNKTTQLNAEGKQILQKAIKMVSDQQDKKKTSHI